jgi:tRNA C32,U32 (ribose-2'-O)-methylase TrmJ
MQKFTMFGSKGSDRHIPVIQFHKLEEACLWLKSHNITLCGVEIVKEAQPVHKHPFRGSTCIMLGNEGSGMNDKQIAACDHFVYIEQYGHGTASLNVTVAASIVMHHLALWAGYTEAPREDDRAKFVVSELDRSIPLERSEFDLQKQAERESERQLMSSEVEASIGVIGSLYNDDDEGGEEAF